MLESGKKIDDYVLVQKLGAGGFGEVWKAEKHTKLSVSNVALKFFRPKEEDKISLEKEKREIGIWQKVSGMPNIISIIEADEFEEYIYVVSEFADGGSLEKQIASAGGRAFPINQAVTITLEILSGLNSLHQMSFVHRDIKPANILMRRGVYCLADFGISREMKAHSKSTQTAGTYEYMSPEAFENKPVTIHSDIWAAGAIMQQLLTGGLPFAQTEIPSLIYAILHREPEEMPETIPAGLREIVKKSLEKNPARRFNSAAEMIDALKYRQMLLTKPEWGKMSQETVALDKQETAVWDDTAKTKQSNAAQLISPPAAISPETVQSRKTIEPPIRQTEHFSLPVTSRAERKKSSRKALFAILGGGGFLILLLTVVGFAIVYRNSNLFTKDAADNPVSNVNANLKTEKAETNKNNNRESRTATENLPSSGNESSSASEGGAVDSTVVKPSAVPTVAARQASSDDVKKRETAQPVVRQTPIAKQKNTPPKATKNSNPDCIFNGDC